MKESTTKTNKHINYQLITSIIGILTVFVMFLTLTHLMRQHKTAIKPDIVINDKEINFFMKRYTSDTTFGFINIYTTNKEIDTLILSNYKSSSQWKILPSHNQNSFRFELINIGLGTAKSIKLKWSFDTIRISQIYSNYKLFNMLDTIIINRNSICLCEKHDTICYFEFEKYDEINFILPYQNNKSIIELPIPVMYLKALLFNKIIEIQSSVQNNKWLETEFPQLNLELSYKDISNNLFQKHWEVTFKRKSFVGNSNKFHWICNVNFKEIK